MEFIVLFLAAGTSFSIIGLVFSFFLLIVMYDSRTVIKAVDYFGFSSGFFICLDLFVAFMYWFAVTFVYR